MTRTSLLTALGLLGCSMEPLTQTETVPPDAGQDDAAPADATSSSVLGDRATFKRIADLIATSTAKSPIICDYRSIAGSYWNIPYLVTTDAVAGSDAFALGFRPIGTSSPGPLTTLVEYWPDGRNQLTVTETDIGRRYQFTFDGFLVEQLTITRLHGENLYGVRYTNETYIAIDCDPYVARGELDYGQFAAEKLR